MHITDAEEITANAEALGLILGVTGRTVANLEDKNAVVKLERGKYDVPASIKTYIAWQATEKKINQHSGGADYEAERTRLTAAKADMAEHQRDVMVGKLHDADAVRHVWTENVTNAKSKILGLGAAIAPQLDGLGIVERKTVLDNYAHTILADLAEYSPERITGEYIEAHADELATRADDEG